MGGCSPGALHRRSPPPAGAELLLSSSAAIYCDSSELMEVNEAVQPTLVTICFALDANI